MLLGGFIRCARTLFSGSTCFVALISIVCWWALFSAANAGAMKGSEGDELLQQLSPEAQEMLKKLVELASVDYHLKPVSEQEEEAHREFHSLLGTLGQQIGDSLGMGHEESAEPNIERSLIAMAVDRARNPTHYEELSRTYGVRRTAHSADGSQKHVIGPANRSHAPPLRSEHATEDYRVAWESLWLGPPSADTQRMRRGVGFIDEHWAPADVRLLALAKIGNDESIPVILYRNRLGLQSCSTGIIGALAYFCSEEALRGILDWMAAWEEADPDEPVLINKGDLAQRTLQEHVLLALTNDRVKVPRLEGWRDIIKQFPKDGLPFEQRELLEQVLAFKRETEEGPEAP